ncbi:MAG: hypothetical protein Q9217_001363 [Psora testacea]
MNLHSFSLGSQDGGCTQHWHSKELGHPHYDKSKNGKRAGLQDQEKVRCQSTFQDKSRNLPWVAFNSLCIVALLLCLFVPWSWWPGAFGNLISLLSRILRPPNPEPTGPFSASTDHIIPEQAATEVRLAPFTLEPLPLGSVKPGGWIGDQLELMARGLAGHQYDFYHIVKHSPWVGGHSEYSPLNEGLPYWFNGIVPLAYGLNDTRLQSQVLDILDKVFAHQHADGWLGPEPPGHRDLWARFPLCLGLIQLAEANPRLSKKIVPAMYRFIDLMHYMLADGRGFWDFWGLVRYPDMLVSLQWLYEKYPWGKSQVLLETMYLLSHRGFSWPDYWTESNYIFADLDTIQPPIRGDSYRYRHSHSVNVGQGLSAGAALYRFTKNDSFLEANRRGVNWTFYYHGDPAGSIIGDERESGLGPNRGSELCTAVETMYSLSYLYQVMGDKDFADRCELAAFNALPVSITNDHWARQYLAVANEPFARTIHGPNPFYNTGAESLVYGLDPNYPCCTVNMPQGLPKFLSASFVRVGPDGIGHALLGPASLSTTTASGVSVNITCATAYPFNHTLTYEVASSAPFTLYLRVPSWYLPNSAITILEKSVSFSVSPDPHTGMTPISLGSGTHTLIYNLDTDIRVTPRGNSSVSIYHGALLYALDVGQSTDIVARSTDQRNTYSPVDERADRPRRVHNIEISNTRPWNIGIDPSTLIFHTKSANAALANPIFDYHAPPTFITGKGCQIDWPLYKGLPAALPKLRNGVGKRNCTGNITDVVLRPYGSLKVHMAELPVVDLEEVN